MSSISLHRFQFHEHFYWNLCSCILQVCKHVVWCSPMYRTLMLVGLFLKTLNLSQTLSACCRKWASELYMNENSCYNPAWSTVVLCKHIEIFPGCGSCVPYFNLQLRYSNIIIYSMLFLCLIFCLLHRQVCMYACGPGGTVWTNMYLHKEAIGTVCNTKGYRHI